MPLCNDCEALSINGVLTHEFGCPSSPKKLKLYHIKVRQEEIRMHEFTVWAENKEQAELLWEDDPFGDYDNANRVQKTDEYWIADTYDLEEIHFNGDDEE